MRTVLTDEEIEFLAGKYKLIKDTKNILQEFYPTFEKFSMQYLCMEFERRILGGMRNT